MLPATEHPKLFTHTMVCWIINWHCILIHIITANTNPNRSPSWLSLVSLCFVDFNGFLAVWLICKRRGLWNSQADLLPRWVGTGFEVRPVVCSRIVWFPLLDPKYVCLLCYFLKRCVLAHYSGPHITLHWTSIIEIFRSSRVIFQHVNHGTFVL